MIETAPSGPNVLPFYTGNSSALLLTLLNSYTVHDFMIQLITVNPQRKDYPKIIILLYLIGNLAFMFISFSAVGIIKYTQGWSIAPRQ